MNFKEGQKVRLVAKFFVSSIDEDGDVVLNFRGRTQHIPSEVIEERLEDDKAIVCVEYSYSYFSSLYGDTFVFETAPGRQNLYLQEEHIVLAEEENPTTATIKVKVLCVSGEVATISIPAGPGLEHHIVVPREVIE